MERTWTSQGHPRSAAVAEEEARRGCEAGWDAAPPVGGVYQGYAVQDPRVYMYGLRPRRFDGMAALEAGDQHKEEIR